MQDRSDRTAVDKLTSLHSLLVQKLDEYTSGSREPLQVQKLVKASTSLKSKHVGILSALPGGGDGFAKRNASTIDALTSGYAAVVRNVAETVVQGFHDDIMEAVDAIMRLAEELGSDTTDAQRPQAPTVKTITDQLQDAHDAIPTVQQAGLKLLMGTDDQHLWDVRVGAVLEAMRALQSCVVCHGPCWRGI